jgi:hypothetical protein
MKRVLAVVAASALVGGVVWTAPALSSTTTAAPSLDSHLKIKEYGTNAPGTDTSANRNYEFVRLTNTAPAGSDPLNVEGWVLHDTYQTGGGDWGNRYTLKGSVLPAGSPFKAADDTFQIPAGASVYIYNGSGVDSQPTNNVAALYRNFKHHWNNAGDTIYVRKSASSPGYVAAVVYTSYRVKLYQ